MKPILMAGMGIVNLALIFYTIFIFSERKSRKASKRVLSFLTLGVLMDASATLCMIIGSTHTPFTLHGILGYTSLSGMLADAFFIWRTRIRKGPDSPLSAALHNYSLAAYAWWIIAYITGALLVMVR